MDAIQAVGVRVAVKNFTVFSNKTHWLKQSWVVVSNIYSIFTPIPGEMIQFDEHILPDGLKPPTRELMLPTTTWELKGRKFSKSRFQIRYEVSA